YLCQRACESISYGTFPSGRWRRMPSCHAEAKRRLHSMKNCVQCCTKRRPCLRQTRLSTITTCGTNTRCLASKRYPNSCAHCGCTNKRTRIKSQEYWPARSFPRGSAIQVMLCQEGMKELIVDCFDDLADARQPATQGLWPRRLAIPFRWTDRLGAVGLPPCRM